MTQPIPAPKGLPFVGNLFDVADEEVPPRALEHMSELYGPVYKLQRKNNKVSIVSAVAIAEELFDESRFKKPHQELWRRTFGPMTIEAMYTRKESRDARYWQSIAFEVGTNGSEHPISVTDDFTRLTLDIIALCAMDFRFNSYKDEIHTFVNAMLPAIVTSVMRKKNVKYHEDQDYMFRISQELVKHRRENPTEKRDLLNAMIHGTDPSLGNTIRDDLIIAKIITFLIGMRQRPDSPFAFLNMLQNPQAYYAAQREVDEVISRYPITGEQLNKLDYLNAVLRETLRLTPTALIITKQLAPSCTGARATPGNGKFTVEPETKIMILIGAMQRDPSVYSEDANEFRPERMMGENFKKLPSAAWKPFENGVRACIGRAFAWQEALMVTAMLLQSFDFQLDDPAYKLRIKQTLTIKPTDLKMRATLRHKMGAVDLERVLHGALSTSTVKPMTILYGSNTGSCTTFAQRLASSAASHGFKVRAMKMDVGVDRIPKSQLVIIITASYKRQPTDNGGTDHDAGDWTSIYQLIPTLVDTFMEKSGFNRLVSRRSTDASQEYELRMWDYLAVLSVNSEESVRRVISRFKLPWDSTIVKGHNSDFLPMNTPLSIQNVLVGHVELFEPATKPILQACANSTPDQDLKATLQYILSEPHACTPKIVKMRVSTISLLEQHPSITLHFSTYLKSFSPLLVRCMITYSILSSPSLSSPDQVYNDVTGTYLSILRPGDQVKVSVRPSAKALFRLPLNIAETPLLRLCAGIGLAPFRGFIQQRAMISAASPNRPFAPALLFVGCRSSASDHLYASEFDAWIKAGVVRSRG
ncbi:cytochrome P450 [Acephala macrosclerotiorum]|nr:cytochrome P450 [Acephala macrosclerotiorum]